MSENVPFPNLEEFSNMLLKEETEAAKLESVRNVQLASTPAAAPARQVLTSSSRRLPSSSSSIRQSQVEVLGHLTRQQQQHHNNIDLDNNPSVDQGHVTEGRGISAADLHTDVTGSENYIGLFPHSTQ